jgi:membrane protein implicated in regulation of membrane protease activity
MKKSRLIFYLIFALFHIGAFIFTVALGADSGFLMSMFSWVPYFKWVTLLGVLFVLVDFIWSWVAAKDRSRETQALSHEVNTLKAKLFDLQEDIAKKTSAPKPINPSATQP